MYLMVRPLFLCVLNINRSISTNNAFCLYFSLLLSEFQIELFGSWFLKISWMYKIDASIENVFWFAVLLGYSIFMRYSTKRLLRKIPVGFIKVYLLVYKLVRCEIIYCHKTVKCFKKHSFILIFFQEFHYLIEKLKSRRVLSKFILQNLIVLGKRHCIFTQWWKIQYLSFLSFHS